MSKIYLLVLLLLIPTVSNGQLMSRKSGDFKRPPPPYMRDECKDDNGKLIEHGNRAIANVRPPCYPPNFQGRNGQSGGFGRPPQHHMQGQNRGNTTFSTPLTNEVSITKDQNYIYIKSNDIPEHETGDFPNRNNPNRISAQRQNFKVPANPKIASKVTKLGLHPFGVALNGVIFDPAAAEFWDNDRNSGWSYNALSDEVNLGMDQNNAHVQSSGAYHYHGMPNALTKDFGGQIHSKLIGFAADGFPIYAKYGYRIEKEGVKVVQLDPSYRLKAGTRIDGPEGKYDGTFVEDYKYAKKLGDLDECNGKFGFTPDYPNGTYHYFLTKNFPYIPRCFKGTPDSSFFRAPRGAHSRR